MKLSSQRRAFTLIELLVVIAIIGILASFVLPNVLKSLKQAELTKTMSNGKQIYQSAFQMATDGSSTGDPKYGWPGDLAVSTTNQIQNVSQYIQLLISGKYLGATDVGKLTSAPGITPWDGVSTYNGDKNCAFKIYKCTSTDTSAVFLATKNFVYNKQVDEKAVPFGDLGFVIVHMGGDGQVFKATQSQSPNVLGLLPGRQSITDNPSESTTDYLAQQ